MPVSYTHLDVYKRQPLSVFLIIKIKKYAIADDLVKGLVFKRQIGGLADQNRIVQQLDVASDECRGIVDARIIAVQILGQRSGAASDLQYLIFLLNIEAAADLSSHLFHINMSALISIEGKKILYAALCLSLACPDLLRCV